MKESIGDIFDSFENEYADRIAFQWLNKKTEQVQKVTYLQYAEDIRRCIAFLQKKLGDLNNKHIALLAQYGYEYLVYMYAIMLAGGVVAALNIQNDKQEILYELDLGDIVAVIQDGFFTEREGSLDDYNGMIIDTQMSFESNSCLYIPEQNTEKLAMLLFTSGTTGRSKAVMLSQKAIINSVEGEGFASAQAKKETDVEFLRELVVLPMCHAACIARIFARLGEGYQLNLCGEVKYLYRDLKQMPSNSTQIVPLILNMFQKDVNRGHGAKLGDLKIISVCGAMVDEDVVAEMVAHGFFMINLYGMTESYVITHNLLQEASVLASIGKADVGYETQLFDGELCFRGKGVMLGYYKNPEETKKTKDNEGWLHTGDLARIDENGNIFLVGRKKNLIILDSGENISPEEIESQICRCSDVIEAVVKEVHGKAVAEIYCDDIAQQNVRQYIEGLNKRFPLYKRINVIQFRSKPFEKTSLGKIKRNFIYFEAKQIERK